MTPARLGNLALCLGIAALSVRMPISRWLEDQEEEKARRTFEAEAARAVMAQVADLSTARLISIRADRTDSACGWIELSPEIGAVSFHAIGPSFDGDDILITLPRLDVTDPRAWAHEVFSKQLNTRLCGQRFGRDEPLPTPANAHEDPTVDRPVLALWDSNGPEWAVIPARGVGFLALRRQVGGGATVSPVFAERSNAELWTRTEGAALASSRDAQGTERMRQFDACLNRYASEDPARRTCFSPAAPTATS